MLVGKLWLALAGKNKRGAALPPPPPPLIAYFPRYQVASVKFSLLYQRCLLVRRFRVFVFGVIIYFI